MTPERNNANALSTELKVKIPLLLIVTAHTRYPIKDEIPQIIYICIITERSEFATGEANTDITTRSFTEHGTSSHLSCYSDQKSCSMALKREKRG